MAKRNFQMAQNMHFFGFLVITFNSNFLKYFTISLLGSSMYPNLWRNLELLLFSYPICSEIWLNCIMDYCQIISTVQWHTFSLSSSEDDHGLFIITYRTEKNNDLVTDSAIFSFRCSKLTKLKQLSRKIAPEPDCCF